MTITIDRSLCCDLNETITREWLITNGQGGYAAGTVAGVLTRKEHGLLVAMSPHAETPHLLLAKIDEEVMFNERTYYLGTNEYRDGTVNPAGFVHLDSFRLEDGFPVFTYRLGSIEGLMLEKRIWMLQNYNTTYIQYRVLRSKAPEETGYKRSGTTGSLDLIQRQNKNVAATYQQPALTLNLLPFTSYRPYNNLQSRGNDAPYKVQVYSTGTDIRQDFNQMLELPVGMAGCTIQVDAAAEPYHLLAIGHPQSKTTFIPTGVWFWNFLHRQDKQAGFAATDDLYLSGVIRATLWPDEEATLTLIVSNEALSSLLIPREQIKASYQEQVTHRRKHVEQSLTSAYPLHERNQVEQAQHIHSVLLASASNHPNNGEEHLRFLLQFADRFLVQLQYPSRQSDIHPTQATTYSRITPDTHRLYRPEQQEREERYTRLFADFFSLDIKTRDMLIALPGLMLVPGHYKEASRVLLDLSHAFIGGLLPDRLPPPGYPLLDADYRSVDTALWYFYALDYYLRTTEDYELLEEVFPLLKECIHHYVQGTYQNIHMDPVDSLLQAGNAGHASTWMNATSNKIAITPRNGKAVEVNALWYHALSLMYEWSQHIKKRGYSGYNPTYYLHLRDTCKYYFQHRFWYEQGGYLYDVVDGPAGNDASLRPNQLLACSLRHAVLDNTYHQQIFDIVTRYLLTPYGLRTLSLDDPAYYGGNPASALYERREAAQNSLFQGGIWAWLIGPYIDTMTVVGIHSQPEMGYKQPQLYTYIKLKGMQILEPLFERFKTGLLGMCEDVFEGDSSHKPYPFLACCGSCMTMGEILRSYKHLCNISMYKPQHSLSY